MINTCDRRDSGCLRDFAPRTCATNSRHELAPRTRATNSRPAPWRGPGRPPPAARPAPHPGKAEHHQHDHDATGHHGATREDLEGSGVYLPRETVARPRQMSAGRTATPPRRTRPPPQASHPSPNATPPQKSRLGLWRGAAAQPPAHPTGRRYLSTCRAGRPGCKVAAVWPRLVG